MKIGDQHHLAYCTNIHRGESWKETFGTLRDYTLSVRDKVCPTGQPYAIGLRLGINAANELARAEALAEFKDWLNANNCYVFTINGFPYGNFHGTRVKEQVYQPDWTTSERVVYTCKLFDILSELLPKGVAGSVSTVPGSFKPAVSSDAQLAQIYDNLIQCAEYIEKLSIEKQQDLHIGLEPEPCCLFETTPETLSFFKELFAHASDPSLVRRRIGINYDTCHLAVEFENAFESLNSIQAAGVRLSKIHFSSAIRMNPSAESMRALKAFTDDIYLHQVIAAKDGAVIARYTDIPEALAAVTEELGDEWRIHFHIPLYADPATPFGHTREHLEDCIQWIQANPEACEHFEMETYTWEVLPEDMQSSDVVEQLSKEYRWVLGKYDA